MPDDHRLFTGVDLIVVFESPYSDYASHQAVLQNLTTNEVKSYSRDNYCYEISGLPTNWTTSDFAGFVDTLKTGASFLFMTDINIADADIYASFGSSWNEFVDTMSTYPQKNI